MAMLVKKGDAARIALSAHALVGRSSACSVRLGAPRASSEHARVHYRDGGWIVRDLGSRNGTYVNGERIASGGGRALAAGDWLAFGDPEEAWTLLDASPPEPMAQRLRTDAWLAGDQGLLVLPSPAEPHACVVAGEGGVWLLEVDGQTREARDGEVIEAGGEPFVLHLPVPLAATADAHDTGARVDRVGLRFRVSPDEESVELAVGVRDEVRVLPPRTHHYMLLTLARARLRDRDAGALAAPQRGWLFVEDVCRMLSIDEIRLNVEIYRVRQEMSALGFTNAAVIVERRRGSRQVRVGTEQITIDKM